MSQRSISQWMQNAIVEGGHRRFDDLHVDEIDPSYSDPEQWVTAALAALGEAARIRDRRGWEFTIALAIPVTSLGQKDTAKPLSAEDLSTELGGTPPSLYAFERGKEPWTTAPATEYPVLEKFSMAGTGMTAYLSERLDPEEREYQRTVWIAR